jgi:hypothetical protein
VLCGYCHLVFHPTCLDPLTGVENWDELAELNAIEYAVKYATKTKPGDYVIDCAPPVAGGAAAAAAVAASEGGRCFTKYKEPALRVRSGRGRRHRAAGHAGQRARECDGGLGENGEHTTHAAPPAPRPL